MDSTQLQKLLKDIKSIISVAESKESELQSIISKVHPDHQKSASNLIHYVSLRQFPMKEIHDQLEKLGLSRIARAESHVLDSLYKSTFYISGLLGRKTEFPTKEVNGFMSSAISKKNMNTLLGSVTADRRVKILVTLPTEAAFNPDLVLNFMKKGMDCVRINCAHDTPEVWKSMIANVRNAEKITGQSVKVTMDLGGPKIRTGSIAGNKTVKKIRPLKDQKGNVLTPAKIRFIGVEFQKNDIPMDIGWLSDKKEGDIIKIKDCRHKNRKLHIEKIEADSVTASCKKSVYFEKGMMLNPKIPKSRVAEFTDDNPHILLHENDILILHKDQLPGGPGSFDDKGDRQSYAHISCTCPEIVDMVQVGEPIFFDDGKIKGIVVFKKPKEIHIKIGQTNAEGYKLKPDKGINLPKSNLNVKGLTKKDKTDLEFIVNNADIVNFSFVNTAEDVKELQEALRKMKAPEDFGIILKIETNKAFNNFSTILLQAMQYKNVGVMIARGDLAIEAGWEEIGWVQRELLALCSAAHIPVIWATQVLENLAKKGVPSRSEITDATQSLKADCVMLNKGPYIMDAIELLDTILIKLENYQSKNNALLPRLTKL